MKSTSYSKFWQRIHKKAQGKGFPLRVMFELTYRCNFKCRHCYVPEDYKKKFQEELKTKEIFSILDQLQDLGCFYLGFTGGEPFLRKDIFDILGYAKKSGFQIIIYTNGSLIDEDKAKELKRLSPNKVDITIPALSRNAFERISGVKGSHKKVFRAIGLLYDNGIKLGFKTCALKENESEIEHIRDFATSLGALHRLDTFLSRRLDGSKEPYQYRGILRQYLVSSQQSAVSSKDKFEECVPNTQHPTPNTQHLFRCGVGVKQAAITPLGELKMCLMIDYPKYKILNTSLRDTWQELRQITNNIEIDENYKCSSCVLRLYCKWCPARGWLYNRKFTSCDPEMCRLVAVNGIR